MHNLDLRPRIDFRARAMDQVVTWLDRRTRLQASALVIVATLIVTGLDFSSGLYELRLPTLYIVPISLACWLFRPRLALAITFALVLFGFAKYSLLEGNGISFANGAIRVVAYGLLAAIVLSFRRTFDYMRILASRDRMTGALNKQAFQQRAQALLDRAYAGGKTVLLLYIDLDGFKNVNDRHGHHVGDQVLVTFSVDAAEPLRLGDCFGRLGGDEFAIAVDVRSQKEGRHLAERFHKRLSGTLRASPYDVTCSMGALIVPPLADAKLDSLMKEADRLMYSVKGGEKDGVRIELLSAPESLESLHSPIAVDHWQAPALPTSLYGKA